MSTSEKLWRRVAAETKTPTQLDEFYRNMHGDLFKNGVNIGLQVVGKLAVRNFDDVWPTVLQANGNDHGLTAGFVTACSVDPNISDNIICHVADSLHAQYGVNVTTRIVETVDQLPVEYKNYPVDQNWSMPAVVIEYASK